MDLLLAWVVRYKMYYYNYNYYYYYYYYFYIFTSQFLENSNILKGFEVIYEDIRYPEIVEELQ